MPPIRHSALITICNVYASVISDPLSHFSLGIGTAFGVLPPVWQFAFAIVFGLAIGSFVNVVAHRLPIMLERAWHLEISEATGQPATTDAFPARYNLCVPRSACPHCGAGIGNPLLRSARKLILLRLRCHCHPAYVNSVAPWGN